MEMDFARVVCETCIVTESQDGVMVLHDTRSPHEENLGRFVRRRTVGACHVVLANDTARDAVEIIVSRNGGVGVAILTYFGSKTREEAFGVFESMSETQARNALVIRASSVVAET